MALVTSNEEQCVTDFLVRLAEGPDDLAAVRDLWREYWISMDLPDDFQGFSEEVQGLPGVYGADGGALLLAIEKTPEATPAGTIALRRLNDRAGEVKRLYLRPAYRGRGLGRFLLENVIQRARATGYQAIYADTLPSMTDGAKPVRTPGLPARGSLLERSHARRRLF